MPLRLVLLLLTFTAALVYQGANTSSPGTAAAQTATSPTTDEDEWQGLPAGKGREETFFTCVPCHSLRMVTQQGLAKWRWNEAIDWMIDEQEMPRLSASERELIVGYLARFYGEDRKAKGGRRKRR